MVRLTTVQLSNIQPIVIDALFLLCAIVPTLHNEKLKYLILSMICHAKHARNNLRPVRLIPLSDLHYLIQFFSP